MADHANEDRWKNRDAAREPTTTDGAETVESYEIEEGIVFYDAENPLAWVESNAAVPLRERA